jgi:56kDa selenium binding protein (SBP56)
LTLLRPDPTFYPSPKMAMEAPAEKLAYLALLNPKLTGKPDAIAVVDVDPASKTYSQVVGRVEMPNAGDELHHFGWNACSSCLAPYAPHAHMERRYLIVPGIRSSRIHSIDTKPDPRNNEGCGTRLWGQYKIVGQHKVKVNWAAKEFLGSEEEVEYACGHVVLILREATGAKRVMLAQKGNVLMCAECANRLIKCRVASKEDFTMGGLGKVLGKKPEPQTVA